MKKWNNPEIVVLNISETAKPGTCNVPGGKCVNPQHPSNNGNGNGNGYGICKDCPYFTTNGVPTPTPGVTVPSGSLDGSEELS